MAMKKLFSPRCMLQKPSFASNLEKVVDSILLLEDLVKCLGFVVFSYDSFIQVGTDVEGTIWFVG